MFLTFLMLCVLKLEIVHISKKFKYTVKKEQNTCGYKFQCHIFPGKLKSKQTNKQKQVTLGYAEAF